MKLLRRHKYVLIGLGIYWPAIFVLTHIPVPPGVATLGMSDKTMHVLAYLVLVVFVWLSISPYEKVSWKKLKVWIVLAAMVGYGIIDEFLQARIGRSPDRMDFLADITGVLLGLAILTAMSFWPAMVAVSAIFIFVVSNLSNILGVYSPRHLDTVFAFTAYGAFTLIWIQHLSRLSPPGAGRPWWGLWAISVPLGLLGAVSGCGVLMGKAFFIIDASAAVFGISAAALLSYATLRFGGGRRTKVV